MARFQGQAPTGGLVQELEGLVRTAIFKPANALVGHLLQGAADRMDAAYQPNAGKAQGHYPADVALGLEVGYTPALARILCLEGADQTSYQKAEPHLAETGSIAVGARQIERVMQRVGPDAQAWQERGVQPRECAPGHAPILYVSADGTGAPMRAAELRGRADQQPDGTAKTRQVYLGCVFTQHAVDAEGHPVRDWESTTYVSSLDSIDAFGPLLRREALRRGLGTAGTVVLLIDGAVGLEHMGHRCFAGWMQIVDVYHAMEDAGAVLQLLLGSQDHPDYKRRLRRWAKRSLKGPSGASDRGRWWSSATSCVRLGQAAQIGLHPRDLAAVPEEPDRAVVLLKQRRVDLVPKSFARLHVHVATLGLAGRALQQAAAGGLPGAVPAGQAVGQPERVFEEVNLRRPKRLLLVEVGSVPRAVAVLPDEAQRGPVREVGRAPDLDALVAGPERLDGAGEVPGAVRPPRLMDVSRSGVSKSLRRPGTERAATAGGVGGSPANRQPGPMLPATVRSAQAAVVERRRAGMAEACRVGATAASTLW